MISPFTFPVTAETFNFVSHCPSIDIVATY